MVVQHNLTAMNSNRMLGLTTTTQAKSTEKLSSGYKINRAADDAAGLSISEKMRKQIRGLTQASTNAQDGISAVQTAEGALNEVQDMLQRMNELAVKAANGTNSEDDRSYIQNEIDQLVDEIDRVAETTKFNETYLLKGEKDTTANKFQYNVGDTAAAEGEEETGGTEEAPAVTAFTSLEALREALEAGTTIVDSDGNEVNTTGWTYTEEETSYDEATGLSDFAADTTYYTKEGDVYTPVAADAEFDEDTTYYTATTTPASISGMTGEYSAYGTLGAAGEGGGSGDADEVAGPQYYDKDGNKIPANALNNYFTVDDSGNVSAVEGKVVYDKDGAATELSADDVELVAEDKRPTGPLTLTLHVGADATANNQISVAIDSMSATGLGVDGLKVDGADDSNALNAIDTIKEAIQKVSTQRSALGAAQNRLEHTINNLDNVVENTTSAESNIRDTNMATEMVKYSNNNILAQAGQAMLAQANQSNQGVLSLLG